MVIVQEQDESVKEILAEVLAGKGTYTRTFRGDNQIAREEAMVMYPRAMKITKLIGSDDSRCESYTDYSQVSDWAKTNIKNILSALYLMIQQQLKFHQRQA
ncbi:hypothetical protein CLNEO_24420 [Anaerotignum neopropionicum]|uniref:Uncharacterized protein n=1 Tax=Anaerotignum neopropionicum TaxID=36847 RepID=A0A136WC58_9FIRM|nr:hypothetical protein [Anaerotignum neopropionicum]KXL52093.1 hypothetical protein CLNEO_24420 [Anaerotignum neopropionicum]